MWFVKGFTNKTQDCNGSGEFSFHKQIIEQLRKILIVETNYESTFYVNFGGYTRAIVIGQRNQKVMKFYRK